MKNAQNNLIYQRNIYNIPAIEVTTMDIIRSLLNARGINQDPVNFLSPSISQLRDPDLMFQMNDFIRILRDAITRGKKIRIMGDYDADGITATVIMMLGLRKLSIDPANIDFYIPTRTEGYGLNKEAIMQAITDQIDVIITVDNGITCRKEVEYAVSAGIVVLVTDHHLPQNDHLPLCPILNPHYGNINDFHELSGAGVAILLIISLFRAFACSDSDAHELLPFAAIGTIADVMPLIQDNRVIAYNGLLMMSSSKNYGLRNLMKIAGLEGKEITVRHIGYQLAPIINAAGRMGIDKEGNSVSASDVVEMFLDTSRLRSYRTAMRLKKVNELRQEQTAQYATKIIEYIEQHPEIRELKIIVLFFPDLPEGLVGLIAGKLKEKYSRPVLLMTNDSDQTARGSGRSIPAYDMFAELQQLSTFFTEFGGHSMACGFQIPLENIRPLRSVLNSLCQLDFAHPTEDMAFVSQIDPALLTLELADTLKDMAPFGKGNEKPSFIMTQCKVISWNTMGENKDHLSIKVEKEGYSFSCVAFRMAKEYKDEQIPSAIDIRFFPQSNTWKGRTTLQLNIETLKGSDIINV